MSSKATMQMLVRAAAYQRRGLVTRAAELFTAAANSESFPRVAASYTANRTRAAAASRRVVASNWPFSASVQAAMEDDLVGVEELDVDAGLEDDFVDMGLGDDLGLDDEILELSAAEDDEEDEEEEEDEKDEEKEEASRTAASFARSVRNVMALTAAAAKTKKKKVVKKAKK